MADVTSEPDPTPEPPLVFSPPAPWSGAGIFQAPVIFGASGGSLTSAPAGTGPFRDGTVTSAPTETLPSRLDGATITSINRRANLSSVRTNINKLATMPPGITETDGYKETWRSSLSGATGGMAQASISRYFLCPWSQARAAVTYWLGYSGNIIDPNDGNHGFLFRVPPDQSPRDPALYATEVRLLNGIGAWVNDPSIVPLDADGAPILNAGAVGAAAAVGAFPQQGSSNLLPPGGTITSVPVIAANGGAIPYIAYAEKRGADFFDGGARFEVVFCALDLEIRDDADMLAYGFGEIGRWVQRRYLPSIQAIQVPIGNVPDYIFTDGPYQGLPIAGSPTYLMPTIQCEWVWYDVPDLNHDAFRACAGCVNPDLFDGVPGYGGALKPGTLLMNPPRYERYRQSTLRYAHKVTFSGVYRETGWNSFLAQDGNFWPIRHKSGALLYKYPRNNYRFADLFKMPLPVFYQ